MQQLSAFWTYIYSGAAHAATYHIPEPSVPIWVWPLLAVLGIFCQIIAVCFRNVRLVILGLILVLGGAAMDRDITLAVGDVAACLGLAYGMKKW